MKKDTEVQTYSKEVVVLGENLDTFTENETHSNSKLERNILDRAINIKIDLLRYLNQQGLPICEYMTIHDIIRYLQT